MSCEVTLPLNVYQRTLVRSRTVIASIADLHDLEPTLAWADSGGCDP